MSRSAASSRLPDLLHQATAPGVLTSCCDFPLQDLPETVLKKTQAPQLAQKSSRQLAPCLRPCCAAPFVMWPVLISPPHPPSPTLLILLSSPQATPNRFSLLRSLFAFPLRTRSFSQPPTLPSCRLTFYPSHPPVPFVHAGGGRCQLSCSTCPTSGSCPPPSQEMEGGRATGLPASCRPPQGHSQQSGRLGRKAGLRAAELLPFGGTSNAWIQTSQRHVSGTINDQVH